MVEVQNWLMHDPMGGTLQGNLYISIDIHSTHPEDRWFVE
jgi:hypothetical protein